MEFGARQWADRCDQLEAKLAAAEARAERAEAERLEWEQHADRLAAALRDMLAAIDSHADLDRLQWGEPIEVAIMQARAAFAASPADSGAEWAAMREVCEAAVAFHDAVCAAAGGPLPLGPVHDLRTALDAWRKGTT